MNDSRRWSFPLSSLSRCLSVLTAIGLAGPGFDAGAFFSVRAFDNRPMGSSSVTCWVKAFHIIFVASWFAALFYLAPRLFVNLALVARQPCERERLLLMARKLYRFAGPLLMVPALPGPLARFRWSAWGRQRLDA